MKAPNFNSMTTIYFAGSITGGRDDQPIYEQIIEIGRAHV